MNLGFRYHPAARAEARRAVEFYRTQSVGVAEQFLEFLDRAIDLVVEEPLIGHPVKAGVQEESLHSVSVFTDLPVRRRRNPDRSRDASSAAT